MAILRGLKRYTCTDGTLYVFSIFFFGVIQMPAQAFIFTEQNP